MKRSHRVLVETVDRLFAAQLELYGLKRDLDGAGHRLQVQENDFRRRLDEAVRAAKEAHEKLDRVERPPTLGPFETEVAKELFARSVRIEAFEEVVATALREFCPACRRVATEGGSTIPNEHPACIGALRAIQVVQRASESRRRPPPTTTTSATAPASPQPDTRSSEPPQSMRQNAAPMQPIDFSQDNIDRCD